MQRKLWSAAFLMSLLTALPANAQIIKGVMAIKGAEMSWWGGMARDAIARQYDVERNSMVLTCAEGKGSYRPGTISFQPKKGRTLDLNKIRDSITATRLSGGTGMSVDYFEITAVGAVSLRDQELLLTVAKTEQQFTLAESAKAKGQMQKLRDALGRGEKVTSVTGHVEGWNGTFPPVLRALANAPPIQTLQLIDFEIAK